MHRAVIYAGLLLTALSTRGEPIEAIYREGEELIYSGESSFEMNLDEMSVALNGEELPPEAIEGMTEEMPSSREETTMRCRDTVLETDQGVPTRVRRIYDELRKHETENGVDDDQVGPLEGRSLLLTEVDGTTEAELEDDGEEVDELYLADHRITRDADLVLPGDPVEIGDTWSLAEENVREILGMSGPVFFELDEGQEDDPFVDLLMEASTFHGEARFAAVEERAGLRCAVIESEIELDAETDDLEILGMELEEGIEPTGSIRLHMEVKDQLWHALAEGRPVFMQSTLQGTLEFQVEIRGEVAEQQILMTVHATGSVRGEASAACEPAG